MVECVNRLNSLRLVDYARMTPVPENLATPLNWLDVSMAMAPSRNYWLNTINADSSPHVSAVWGVASDDNFYFFTSRGSIKARNLGRDVRAALHLESAQDVVITYGYVQDLGDPTLLSEVMSALKWKYDQPGDADYLPVNDRSYDVLYRFIATRALLWRLDEFDTTQRRWSLDSH
jgi:hypothetical protein